MKKLVSLVLTVAILMMGTIAMAGTSDIQRFAEYTDVDLSVFIDKGYNCDYDGLSFSAEIYPAGNVIDSGSGWKTIQLDIKVLYSAGSCRLIPRMIFENKTYLSAHDNCMSKVYIRNGENRYIIDTADCSHNSVSEYVYETSVKPIYMGGMVMLEDLAMHPKSIEVGIEVPTQTTRGFELTDADKRMIKGFYETCKQAGIFDQPFMKSSDDFYILTLFNKNSVEAEEDAVYWGTTPAVEE